MVKVSDISFHQTKKSAEKRQTWLKNKGWGSYKSKIKNGYKVYPTKKLKKRK